MFLSSVTEENKNLSEIPKLYEIGECFSIFLPHLEKEKKAKYLLFAVQVFFALAQWQKNFSPSFCLNNRLANLQKLLLEQEFVHKLFLNSNTSFSSLLLQVKLC